MRNVRWALLTGLFLLCLSSMVSGQTLSVSLPQVTAAPGQQITVPLAFSGLTSANPTSGAFGFLIIVTYDPGVLEIVSATSTATGFSNQSNKSYNATQFVLSATESSGEIIGFPDGNIAEVVFNVIGTVGQTSVLTISSGNNDMFTIGVIGEYDLVDMDAQDITHGRITVALPPTTWSITPSGTVSFGTVKVGEDSSRTFTVTNTGDTQDLLVTGIAATGEFSADTTGLGLPSKSVAPGAHISFPVTFSPVAPGDSTGTLTVTTANGSPNAATTVPLQGRGAQPDINVGTLGFSDVAVKRSSTKNLVIGNTGEVPLIVSSVQITDSGGGSFALSSTFSETAVPAESSINVSVRFTPADTVAYAGVVRIISDDPNEGPLDVNLTTTWILDATGTTVTAAAERIAAHPDSTSTITVIPMDAQGRRIDPAFVTVMVSTTAGTFTGGASTAQAAHQGDSTYATLLHAEEDVAKIATIRATVSGHTVADTATVAFVPSRVVVSLPDTVVAPGETVLIPVRIRDAVGAEIVSAKIYVSYRSDVMTAIDVETSGTLTGTGWLVEHAVTSGSGSVDTLKIAMATGENMVSVDGVLAFLEFTVLSSPSGISPLKLEYVLLNSVDVTSQGEDGSLAPHAETGTIASSPAGIWPGETVTLTLTDGDLNRAPTQVETAGLLTVNLITGERDSAAYTETGVNTGVFTRTVSTIFGTAAGTDDDGTLAVSAGDRLRTIYRDAMTAGFVAGTDTANTLVIGGSDGMLGVTEAIQPGDTLWVKVSDSDENGNPAGIDTVSVTAEHGRTGEADVLRILETGANTGIFRGYFKTVRSSSVGADNDGRFNVVREDTVKVTYDDALRVNGGTLSVESSSVTVGLFGDLDSDGIVTPYDAHLVLLCAVGKYTVTGVDALAADVSGDGNIQGWDASCLLKYSIGLIPRFDRQSGVLPKRMVGTRAIAFGQIEKQGTEFVLPVCIDEMDGVVSGQMDLCFDDSRYVVTGVSGADLLDGYMLVSNVLKDEVRIAFAGATSSSGSGPMLHICFRPTEDDGSADKVFTISHVQLNGGRLDVHTTPAGSDLSDITMTYRLYQNVPNPFNPETTIRYQVPMSGVVRLAVYSITGQLLRTLVEANRPAGTHSVLWDGRDDAGQVVASGVYVYRMDVGRYTRVRKMAIVR